jgi:hypothetical protein
LEVREVSSTKHFIVVVTLVLALARCGCPFFTTRAVAQLSDLTLCQGLDDEEGPIDLPDPVPQGETHICACGHLETDRDVYLQVFWGREETNLARDLSMFGDGPFLACIEREEGFEPGHYAVTVLSGKTQIARLEFSVDEGQEGSP